MDEWTLVLLLPNLDMRGTLSRAVRRSGQDRRLVQSRRLGRKKTALANAVNLCTWWVRNSGRRWVRFREAETSARVCRSMTETLPCAHR
jgi:hypothetical protein